MENTWEHPHLLTKCLSTMLGKIRIRRQIPFPTFSKAEMGQQLLSASNKPRETNGHLLLQTCITGRQ